MANAAIPYGFYPRRVIGSGRNTSGCTHYPVIVEPGATIYYGGLVHLAANGSVKAIAASPTTAGSTDSPVGVLQGARWTDPMRGPVWQPSLPTGLIAAGCTGIVAYVNDDPDLVLMGQATATLDLSAVGQSIALKASEVAKGNPTTGRSIASLDAATLSAANTSVLGFRIVRVLDPGALFPDVLVQYNGATHQFRNGFIS